jgi:hypothetical protein
MTGFQFFIYCKQFYSLDGGIYPIANEEHIRRACRTIYKLKNFHGDSVDREKVRALIEAYQLIEECFQ